MFIPFFNYIETSFSTYFSMYLSTHPVMPPFILPLCQHRAFTHCLTVSSTFPRNLHLLSTWVFSIFTFIAFVFVACSCAAIISDSVSFFILLYLSHNHFSTPATTSIWLKNCPYNFFCFNTLLRLFLLHSLIFFTLNLSQMFIISIHSSSCYEQSFLTC